jgi:uncharacterized protein
MAAVDPEMAQAHAPAHAQELADAPMGRTRRIEWACETGNLPQLQEVFPDGPTNAPDIHGFRILSLVAYTTHTHLLDWLLTFPLDVNAGDMDGNTPLMVACFLCCEDMARRLLAHGANVHAQNAGGHTALHLACMKLWAEGIALLLHHNADPNALNRAGKLPEEIDIQQIVPPQNPAYLAMKELLDDSRQGCGLK